MAIRLDIQLSVRFIIMTNLTDGIIDLQFKCVSDYVESMQILKDFKCKHVGFQANEGEYYHIFTNNIGIRTLKTYLE